MLVLAVILLLPARASAKEQEAFLGERTVVCTVSDSDLENFVSGGRSSLEMMISREQSDWFTCRTSAHDRDLYLTLRFSFESYSDYEEKVSFLLGYEPVTTYGDDGAPYIENFAPEELLGFVSEGLISAGATAERSFVDILKTESDTTVLNDTEYTGEGALNTSESGSVAFESISMTTKLEESWTREIECTIAEGSPSGLAVMEERSGRCGASFEGDDRWCKITFTTDTEEELIEKTMQVLETAVNIRRSAYGGDEKTVRMEVREDIDLEPLLTESGSFYSRLELPETYQNLSADLIYTEDTEESGSGTDEDGPIYVSGTTITTESTEGMMRYYYDEELGFDRVIIRTDLSNELKRTKRSITFFLSGTLAADYHDQIKEELKKKLERGDSLRIYEENGSELFEVSHSSWFTDDLQEFTDRILETKGDQIQVTRHVLPLLESSVTEKFSLEESGLNVYSGKVEVRYDLPGITQASGDVSVSRTESQTEKYITANADTEYSESFVYKTFHYKKLILYAAALLVVLLLVLFVYLMIRRKIRRRRKKKMIAAAPAQMRYCPKCGAQHRAEARFCKNCGRRFY